MYKDKDSIIVNKEHLGDNIFKINEDIKILSEKCKKNNIIDNELYRKYDVKEGLRDLNGKGVLAGLTNISDIQAKKIIDGKEIPIDGELYYRGYNIKDIVKGFTSHDDFGYEEIAYLLLFGELPTRKERTNFRTILAERRDLPTNFTRDVIMKSPSKDMMNNMARAVLMLYTYDPNADDTSIENVLIQSLNLIGTFPRLMVYSYHAYKNRELGEDLFIHSPREELSTAENILYMLRQDKKYHDLEAKVLDMALVLHMDHGGGNNSTFTTKVVTSSGTDTYSTIASALGSLKGPKHGGANKMVSLMFNDMKEKISNWESEDEVATYLERLLDGKELDNKGLIYGMGHAVYSISDPRANLLKSKVKELVDLNGNKEEFALYESVERLAPIIIGNKKKIYKGVNANVDFYSGLVYSMLKIPVEIFTPLFATARIAGWSAHRLEELQNSNKITRPAYKPVVPIRNYIDLDDRI